MTLNSFLFRFDNGSYTAILWHAWLALLNHLLIDDDNKAAFSITDSTLATFPKQHRYLVQLDQDVAEKELVAVEGLIAIEENGLQATSHMGASRMGFQPHASLLQVKHFIIIVATLDAATHLLQMVEESGHLCVVCVPRQIVSKAVLEGHTKSFSR